MAKKKYEESEGVWRTIGGRRVFIRTGQSLSDAMKESGKFKTKITEQEKKNIEKNSNIGNKENDNIQKLKDGNIVTVGGKENFTPTSFKYENGEVYYKNAHITGDTWAKHPEGIENISKHFNRMEKEGFTIETKEQQLSDIQKQEGIRLNQKAQNGVRDDIKAFLSGKENYDGSKEDFIRDLSNEWGVDKSKVENILHEENLKHPRNFKNVKTITQEEYDKLPRDYKGTLKELVDTAEFRGESKEDLRKFYEKQGFNIEEDKTILENENGGTLLRPVKISKSDWREQVKKNNELMEKELAEYQKNHDISRESDNYYEIFRNNERRNAKIKQEVPTEPYEYIEAYAGYHDKSYKLAGTKMSGKDVVEYGRNSWTGKEYTNDEFMEHLTDSNWHQERKMLEEANLTNQELAYIKDRTTLSQWSVGEELTGSKNVEKMIKEAKNHFASNSNNLMNRYSGTVDYLKKTTNMSGTEILELLKKIEQDKK